MRKKNVDLQNVIAGHKTVLVRRGKTCRSTWPIHVMGNITYRIRLEHSTKLGFQIRGWMIVEHQERLVKGEELIGEEIEFWWSQVA